MINGNLKVRNQESNTKIGQGARMSKTEEKVQRNLLIDPFTEKQAKVIEGIVLQAINKSDKINSIDEKLDKIMKKLDIK